MIHSQELGVSEIRRINMASSVFTHFANIIKDWMTCEDYVRSLVAGRERHMHTSSICLLFLKKNNLLCCVDVVSAVQIII